jgi:hypothetical protein
MGGNQPYSQNSRILIDNPLAGYARRENNQSMALTIDLTNYKKDLFPE